MRPSRPRERKEKIVKDEQYWNDKHPIVRQLYRGRPLPGKQTRAEVDVRRFIWPEDILLDNLIEKEGWRFEDFEIAAHKIQRWIVRNLTYAGDDRLGCSEYWLFPFETLGLLKGDCEDGAILISSLLLGILPKEHHWRVRVSGGWVKAGAGAAQEGHAWATLCRPKDNEWVPIDWCYYEDSDVSIDRKVLLKDRTEYIETWFSFNHLLAWSHRSFAIDGRVRDWKEDEDADEKKEK